jgi:hypothetical protein
MQVAILHLEGKRPFGVSFAGRRRLLNAYYGMALPSGLQKMI